MAVEYSGKKIGATKMLQKVMRLIPTTFITRPEVTMSFIVRNPDP